MGQITIYIKLTRQVVALPLPLLCPADVRLCCYGEGDAASARMLHHVCMEQGGAGTEGCPLL